MCVGGEGGVWRLGKKEIIYLSLHWHHQNDSCIKMGSDEMYFNVSQNRITVSTVKNRHLNAVP